MRDDPMPERDRIRSLDDVYAITRSVYGPQFMLPERFDSVSFTGFQIDPEQPNQAGVIDSLRAVIGTAGNGRRLWRRRAEQPAGIYLAGPPGVGKTHLLASSYQEAAEPKLFATFDEFMAAAGVMRMQGLAAHLASHDVVCVDEIDLGDPASIMLLTSLLGVLLENNTRVIATANASPRLMASEERHTAAFQRELGDIAAAFELIWLDGVDWRSRIGQSEAEPAGDTAWQPALALTWSELSELLASTHPMYDAAWLKRLYAIVLDELRPLDGSDAAIRFVRFIDRVYDRNVKLLVASEPPPPEEILNLIANDRRYQLHYRRCRSRLIELLGYGDQTGLKSTSGSVVS